MKENQASAADSIAKNMNFTFADPRDENKRKTQWRGWNLKKKTIKMDTIQRRISEFYRLI